MNHRISILGLCALLAGPACTVTDGDLSTTAAVAPLDLAVNVDRVTERLATVSGTLALGYTSPSDNVDVEILDNGTSVYTTSLAADARELQLEATVDLLVEGSNTLTILVTYNGETATQTLNVNLASSIAAVGATATDDRLWERTTVVAGAVELGYLSQEPVHIAIQDDGVSVWSANLPAAALSIPFEATVGLAHEGTNTLTVEVSYAGHTATQTMQVAVPGAIASLTAGASTDQLSAKRTVVSGQLDLGFTSSAPVELRVLDNAVPVWTETRSADSLSQPFSFDVGLLVDGENTLIVQADYAGRTATQTLTAIVPSSIESLSLQATSDALTSRRTQVTGALLLGYTSATLVDLTLLDNSVPVWSSSVVADQLSLPIDVAVNLPFEGTNTLTLQADYNGSVASSSTDLVVPVALQAFHLTPPVGPATELATLVEGTATLGFMGPEQAVLTVKVNGQSVATRSLDASQSTALNLSELVPLSREGVNRVEGVLTYQGRQLTDSYQVDVPAGLQSLTLIPPATPTTLSTHVAGTAALGYVSGTPAQLDVLVNGAVAASRVFDASSSTALAFDVAVSLPHAGANDIVTNLRYGTTTLTDGFTVTVPEGVQSFALTPSASTVDVYEVQVTGDATLGYTSAKPALLELLVDGAPVFAQAYDVSSNPTVAFDVKLPLAHDGSNAIVARLTYDGAVYSDAFTVSVVPPAPQLALPNWQFAIDPSVAARLTGDVSVSPPAGWTVAGVATSTDSGLTWVSASNAGGGSWSVTLNNPDIGQHTLLTRVDLMNRGVHQLHTSASTYTVAPQFNCNGGNNAMSPTTRLIQNNRNETRTMLGYFGDPNGGHTVTFTLSGVDQNGVNVTTVGAVTRYGTFGIDADYNVDRFRCNQWNNNPCTLQYDLDVAVDGVQLCNKQPFGVVERF